MLKVTFNNIEGFLNIDTEEVYFYHLKYKSILEAIQNLDDDIKKHKQEIDIMNTLLDSLFIED